jgi:predicted DNA-binding antitoxin AbrB/MazE fold protein
MHEQIEVVYENGVLRPLAPVPDDLQEHQRLTITIEGPAGLRDWRQDADPTVSLQTVREILAKMSGTLAEAVHAEREER